MRRTFKAEYAVPALELEQMIVEFNEEISCIDVLYDLAFLVMDLWRRRLARRTPFYVRRSRFGVRRSPFRLRSMA